MDKKKSHCKGLSSVEYLNLAILYEGSDVDDDEKRALLSAEDIANFSIKTSESPKRPKKVRWLDRCGDNKLAEILEFQPSDGSDSEEEEEDLCLCIIM